MVRLNKTKLTDKQLSMLFEQFSKILSKSNKQKTGQLFVCLLGKEEHIMLAKRLAIIILLLEGKSLYYISENLKVSPATAMKINRQLDNSEFNEIIDLLGKNKKNYFVVLEALDQILHLGGILPHYNGLDRYKGI